MVCELTVRPWMTREGQRLSYDLQKDDRGKTPAVGIKVL
jgi:hypothetical protein